MSVRDRARDADSGAASIDPPTPAATDFYTHVNGGWLAVHRTDELGVDGPFRRARSRVAARLDALIAAETRRGPLRDLRDSFLAAGDDPSSTVTADALTAEFDTCQRLSGDGTRCDVLAELHRAGVHAPIELTVSYSSETGEWTPKIKPSRQWLAYPATWLRAIATRIGLSEDDIARAEEFESVLATAVADARRAAELGSETVAVLAKATLPEVFPGFPWIAWLTALGVPEACSRVVVADPDVTAALASITGRQDGMVLASWYRIRVLGARVTVLGDEVGLSGARRLIEYSFGARVAQLYCDRFASEHVTNAAARMVGALKTSFQEMIDGTTWCTPQGRRYAARRVTDLTTCIGATAQGDIGLDLVLSPTDLFGNLRAVARWKWGGELDRIGRGRETVLALGETYDANGHYDHPTNRLSLGLGLLEPPFLSVAWSDPASFAALGVVVGHELAHCLDLATWHVTVDDDAWAEEDLAALRTRARRLMVQCANGVHEPLPADPTPLAPDRVVNETICDAVGLAIAERAYRREFSQRYDGRAADDGAMRHFYAAWAWTMRATTSSADPALGSHPPARERCNWALRNNDGFHNALRTRSGDPMWLPPEERVTWWG